jgi:hypothetical protein
MGALKWNRLSSWKDLLHGRGWKTHTYTPHSYFGREGIRADGGGSVGFDEDAVQPLLQHDQSDHMKTKSKSNAKLAPKALKAPELTSLSSSAVHVGTKVGPVYVDGFLHFSPFDLTRFELAQAKVLNALQAIGLKKADIDQAKREFEDRVRKVNEDMQHLVLNSRKAEQELKTLHEELQGLYQLDFSQVTYDDVSGRISVLGEPVPEEGTPPQQVN